MKTKLAVLSIMVLTSVAFATYTVPTDIGQIKGAYVQYKDADEITISVGYGECSGYYWEVETATDVLLAPPAVADFVYIYIDDSVSDYPTPTFVSSTVEPTYSEAKLGWYNGDDRCIGAVYTADATTDIYAFGNYKTQLFFSSRITVADNVVGTGSWQHTEAANYDTDIDSVTPVTCFRVHILAQSDDMTTGARARVQVGYVGGGFGGYYDFGPNTAAHQGWFVTGTADRSLQILSEADDEKFDLHVQGYDIER